MAVTHSRPDSPSPSASAAAQRQVDANRTGHPGASPATTTGVLTAGDVIKDRFELGEVLGAGGMGTVYKATDRLTGEPLAIKVLNAELAGEHQFAIALQREALQTMKLSHPNIIRTHFFDQHESCVYVIMEYLEGRLLSALIQDAPGGLPLQEAWPMIEAMGSALAYAHQQGIVHADFKPGNVFVTRDHKVKVLDFGLARLLKPDDKTRIPDIDQAHTPAYASLERLQGGEPDPRDDIYALACSIYKLLCGRHPFAEATALQAFESRSKPKRIRQLNGRQWLALKRGLALQWADRTPRVEDLLRELRPRPSRRAWLWAGAGAGVLTAAGVSIWMLTPESEPPQPVLPTAAPQPVAPLPSGVSADGGLRIWTAASEYRIGDPLQFQITVARPLYLLIFYINSSGEKGILYPTDSMPDRLLTPGTYRFPFPEADFTLDIAGPPGIDRVIAVASDRPIPGDLALIDESGKLTEPARASLPTVAALSYSVR